MSNERMTEPELESLATTPSSAWSWRDSQRLLAEVRASWAEREKLAKRLADAEERDISAWLRVAEKTIRASSPKVQRRYREAIEQLTRHRTAGTEGDCG